MTHFGKIFKKFRQSRGIKLKDVAKHGLSKSQLSRFERGETDLTITKFMRALQVINMPIDEFMYAVHDFRRDELNELLERIRVYITTRDILNLKKLLIEQQEKIPEHQIFHELNIILIKIKLQDISGEDSVSEQDIKHLIDYLFSVEFWGNYEILLFANTLDVFNHGTFMVLSREIVRRSDFYKEIPNNRRIISTLLLNSYITCIERCELMDAVYFEKQLKACFFIETEIYERLVFQYAKELYKLKKTNDTRSIIEMKKCIAALKLAGSNGLAETFDIHLTKLLK